MSIRGNATMTVYASEFVVIYWIRLTPVIAGGLLSLFFLFDASQEVFVY